MRQWPPAITVPLMHAHIGMLRAINRHVERVFNPDRKDTSWGKAQAEAGSMKVMIQHQRRSRRCGPSQGVRKRRRRGKMVRGNDPEGVAFEYEVIEIPS